MSLRKNPRYDLKRNYKIIFNLSIIFSLFLIIAAFKFTPKFVQGEVYIEPPQNVIQPPDIDITIQNKLIPPPLKPITLIEAPGDLDIPDIPIDDNSLNPDAGVAPIPPYPVDDNTEPPMKIFVAVEEPPTPIGGLAAIESNVIYPEIALRAGIQGKVNLLVYIDEEGNVFKVEIAKGIGGGCDEAAIEAVMKTKFKPGMQRGKPVKVRVGLPVRFKINQ
ncbi:TonB family protein [Bacteroidota bacterium]